jgi:hypothetical protein
MKKIAAITSHERQIFLGKITLGNNHCGKTSSLVRRFYYATENIEISVRIIGVLVSP